MVIVSLIQSALEELADYDYQRTVWLGKRPDQQSSLVEAVSRLFDDSGLELALDRRVPVFDGAIDQDLRTLGAAVTRIDSTRSPELIVQDPAMAHVRELAGAIVAKLEEFHPPSASR